MTGFPKPDREQLRQFVETVFRDATRGTFAALRTFVEGGDQVWRPELWSMPVIAADLGTLVNAAWDLAWAAASAPENALFAAPLCTFKSRDRATEKNVAEGLTLSVEIDRYPERARERCEDLLGPATLAVASGGSWVDPETGEIRATLHLHWRLATPARGFFDLARLKEARRRLALLVGADPTGVSIAHPYRWPGTWHRKGEARLARLIR